MERTTDNILTLVSEGNKKNLNDIISNISKWQYASELTCRSCNQHLIERAFSIESMSNCLVIHLDRFRINNNQESLINLSIDTDFTRTPLVIFNNVFILKSAVRLNRNSSLNSKKFSAAVLHNNEWKSCYNLGIKPGQWREETASAYLLFFEKIEKKYPQIAYRTVGFINNHNNCYANSSLQCLLADKAIFSQIISAEPSPLKNIATAYNLTHTRQPLLRSDDLIKHLKLPLGPQEDSNRFLYSLFECYQYLNIPINHTTTLIRKCLNKQCDYRFLKDTLDSILNITIPPEMVSRSFTIYDLLEMFTEPSTLDTTCPKCQNNENTITERFIVNNTSEVLIITLGLFAFGGVKHDLKIKNSSNDKIQIGKSLYILKSAMLHHQSM